MNAIYKERGGGWIGDDFLMTLQATWPFSSLAIYEDKIILKVAWRTAELAMSDVVEVKRLFILPFLAEGVRIFHKNENLPKLLRFWSFGHSRQIEGLINSRISGRAPSGPSQTVATDITHVPTGSN